MNLLMRLGKLVMPRGKFAPTDCPECCNTGPPIIPPCPEGHTCYYVATPCPGQEEGYPNGFPIILIDTACIKPGGGCYGPTDPGFCFYINVVPGHTPYVRDDQIAGLYGNKTIIYYCPNCPLGCDRLKERFLCCECLPGCSEATIVNDVRCCCSQSCNCSLSWSYEYHTHVFNDLAAPGTTAHAYTDEVGSGQESWTTRYDPYTNRYRCTHAFFGGISDRVFHNTNDGVETFRFTQRLSVLPGDYPKPPCFCQACTPPESPPDPQPFGTSIFNGCDGYVQCSDVCILDPDPRNGYHCESSPADCNSIAFVNRWQRFSPEQSTVREWFSLTFVITCTPQGRCGGGCSGLVSPLVFL